MNAYFAPLGLAAAMMAIAVLAIFGVVPEKVAQFAPVALLAMFPGAWLSRQRQCGKAR